MKKHLRQIATAALACALSLTTLAACGNKNASGEATDNASSQADTATAGKNVSDENATYVSQLDIEKYIDIKDYKNIEVTVSSYDVTDEMVDYYFTQQLSQLAPSVASEKFVTDRAVANGDLINLDFAGYKDGVAFDGGTAEGYTLLIGSHSFIDGFEDGLIGVNPGESVDLNLTFPENYGQADLAGADVVFTCKVNGIIPEEEVVALFNVTSGTAAAKGFDGMKATLKSLIEESYESQYQSELENAIAEKLQEMAEFKEEFPNSLIIKYQENAREVLQQYADMYQTDIDTLASQMLGITADQFIQDNSYNQLKIDAALAFVAAKEGIEIDDKELADRIDQYITDSGVDPESEELATLEPLEYKDSFIAGDAMEYLKTVVKVNK